MTRKLKIAIIALALLITLTVLRETGYLTLQYYLQNSITSDNHTNWNNFIATVPYEVEQSRYNTLVTEKCYYDGQLKDMNVTTFFNGEKEGTGSCKDFNVFIHRIENGFLWTPLYKSASFHCDVPIQHVITRYMQNNDSTTLQYYKFSGIVNISGRIRITGICSHRDARKTVTDFVMKEVARLVKQQLEQM